jgi:hypothetical protein
MYSVRNNLVKMKLLRGNLIRNNFVRNNIIKNNRKKFSTISKYDLNKPLCINCINYNPQNAKCYAIKATPVLAEDSRKKICNSTCGPYGKRYEYMGPELKNDREHVKENLYLSGSSLIICKLFIFNLYPPYSMVICVLPLSLTAFYGFIFLEQTYNLIRMEKQEKERLKQLGNL